MDTIEHFLTLPAPPGTEYFPGIAPDQYSKPSDNLIGTTRRLFTYNPRMEPARARARQRQMPRRTNL
jgi:hypothetical protein